MIAILKRPKAFFVKSSGITLSIGRKFSRGVALYEKRYSSGLMSVVENGPDSTLFFYRFSESPSLSFFPPLKNKSTDDKLSLKKKPVTLFSLPQ